MSNSWRSFCLAVNNSHFRSSHITNNLFHNLNGAWRTCHNACSKMRSIIIFLFHLFKFSNKHGGNPVQGCTFGSLNSFKNLIRLKCYYRGHGSSRYHTGKSSKYTAKAVEKRNRNTHTVFFRKNHTFSQAFGIADKVGMGQHNAFGKTRGS
ncbi:Uncharacterized protein dnl_12500 [Desulfonema limicola]|uniref:Uncharacterized protein n=1 Tax=Desulfonema limicola TaxID=45656 RepID=A0A975GF96_9BACT|nr:Uncharacterized protein dnl_12500 [Desulfonema limicola]